MIEGSGLFIGMFNNLAVFIVFVSFYSYIKPVDFAFQWMKPVIMGALFSAALLVCMQVRIPVAEGVLVDQRNAIVVLSTLFCGPLSGFITYLTGVIMRAHLGGAGVQAGIIGLTLSFTAGNLLRLWKGRRTAAFHIVGSFIALIFILPGFLFVGDLANGWQLMKRMALPYGTAIYLGMLFIGFLLQHEDNRIATSVKLQQSELRYKNLYRKLIDISYFIDTEGKIHDVSPSVQFILGYEPEEVLGRYIQEFYLNPEEGKSFLKEIADQGMVRDREVVLKHRNNSEVMAAINSEMEYDMKGSPLGIHGIIRDITKLRESQKEQKRLEKMVTHNQKMESLGTLAGGIAHDFNNILGAILGYAELLKRKLPDDTENSEYILEILKAVERARNMVRQILLFSRKSNPEKSAIDLSSLVNEALGLITQTIPKTVEIYHEDVIPGIKVMGDGNQLHQVIINLVTNAFHALKGEQGTIGITLEKLSLKSTEYGGYRDLRPGNYAVLHIKDNGKGIPEENREFIFDPFFTTKESGKGTGLGLSVVHGIVEKHGGMIRFTTEANEGTCFSVFLPEIDQNRAELPSKMDNQSEQPLGGREHILAVDDEASIINLEKKILEPLGYRVSCFTDSSAALAAFMDTPEDFDLLLTDQTMPGLTGLNLAKRILKESPGFPIIISSGYSSILNRNRAEKSGIRKILSKPFSISELASAIREVLDQSGA